MFKDLEYILIINAFPLLEDEVYVDILSFEG